MNFRLLVCVWGGGGKVLQRVLNLSFERWDGERGSEARNGISENARIHRRADAYKDSEKLLEYQRHNQFCVLKR